MNTKNTITKDHELLNNPSYNIFAVNLIFHKKIEMTIQTLTPQIMIVTNIIKIIKMIYTEIMMDIVAIVENIRKTTIDLILDKDTTIDLEAHIDLDLIIITKEEFHLDLHIDLHIEITQITGITLAQDTDLVLNHKETTLNDIIIHIDLHQDLEILDHDLEHPHETDISVLNLATFHVISKQLNINVSTNLQNKRAKTLTVATQTEVPIIHYISMTCFTEVNHQTRSFNIDFAVANIKYNILGTPFFKKHIQNIDFQQNIMTYIEQHPNLPTKTTFSILQKRITHIFPTSILINVKNQSTLNQDQEKPYNSQLKTIQIYISNLKIIQNSIQQTHIHISYKNLKISFIS